MLGGNVEADGLAGVLPAIEKRCVRPAVTGQIAVVVANRAAYRIGRQVQRLQGVHQDGAAETALDQARFGSLEDFDGAENFRRQQREIETAVGGVLVEPDGLCHRMAVEVAEVEAGIGAVDGDALRRAELAIEGYARYLGQGLGGIGCRQLTDVLGGDHLGDVIAVALAVQRFLQAGADAGDGHPLQLSGLIAGCSAAVRGWWRRSRRCRGCRRGVLRIGSAGSRETCGNAGYQCFFTVRHVFYSPSWLWLHPGRSGERDRYATGHTSAKASAMALSHSLKHSTQNSIRHPDSTPASAFRCARVFARSAEVPAGRADHADLAVFDQAHRHPLQHRAHLPLVEEARLEAAVQ